MRKSIMKSIVAGLAAIVLSAAVASLPADAGIWHGGGGGGWHGGGWHGGGWNGGWRGGAWNGGWRGGYWNGGWRGGYWGPGWGWGSGWGPGWGYAGWDCPGWGWGGGCGWGAPGVVFVGGGVSGPDNGACWVRRRVWTGPHGTGQYLGRRLVNICM